MSNLEITVTGVDFCIRKEREVVCGTLFEKLRLCAVSGVSVKNVSIVVRSLQTYPAPCLHYHIMAVRTLNYKKQLLARLPVARVLDYPKRRQFRRGSWDCSVAIEISLREGHPGSIRSRGNIFFPSPKHPYLLCDAPSPCSMGTWGTAAETRGWPFNSTICLSQEFV